MRPRRQRVCAVCENDVWRELAEEFSDMRSEGEDLTIRAFYAILRGDYGYHLSESALRYHLDHMGHARKEPERD